MVNTRLRNIESGRYSLVVFEKKILHGLGNKIKVICYGHFEVLEKVSDSSYRLILPPYMCIFSVVNVKNIKLYDPSMLDWETDEQVLPTIEDLSLESQS